MPDSGQHGRHERALRLAERVYRALLLAYPAAFRRDYGARMAQAFRDLCREQLARGGAPGLVRLWLRTAVDLVATALQERGRAMRQKLLIPVALILGLLIALVDTSPGWDDTGITAMALLASCGLLGAVEPARPWRWALLVGLWIPAINVARHHSFGSVLALAFCLVGAYLGALAGRLAKRAAGAA